ncbi:hypothetical protein D3C76_1500110 [compost metagenome]
MLTVAVPAGITKASWKVTLIGALFVPIGNEAVDVALATSLPFSLHSKIIPMVPDPETSAMPVSGLIQTMFLALL